MTKKAFAVGIGAVVVIGALALAGLYGTLNRYKESMGKAPASGSAASPSANRTDTAGAGDAPGSVSPREIDEKSLTPAGKALLAQGAASGPEKTAGPGAAVGPTEGGAAPVSEAAGSGAPAPPAPPAERAEGAAAPAPGAAPGSVADASLTPQGLETLLAVRAPVRAYYDAHLDDIFKMGDAFEAGELGKGVGKFTTVLAMKKVRDENLQKTGLSLAEYQKLVDIVYNRWYRATNGGETDLDGALARANKEIEATNAALGESDLPKDREARLYWKRVSLKDEVKRIQWARSQSARDTLAALPPETRALLDRNKERVRGAALLEWDLLTF